MKIIKHMRHILLLVSFLLIYSCKEKEVCNDKEVNSGIIVSDYNFGKCFYFLDSANYVINSIKEYQNLVDQIDSAYIASVFPDCANYELYSIDFTNITLLALHAEGRGCSTAFQRDVSLDEANKQYIYTVTVYECGNCDITEVSMNWVMVPKLPTNYTVTYKLLKN